MRYVFALLFCGLITACGGGGGSNGGDSTPTPDANPDPEVPTPEQPVPDEPDEDGEPPAPLPPVSEQAGTWLRGDLHLHSHHSTDSTVPVAAWIELAEEVGMDYFILTDHDNHVMGDVAGHTWSDPDYASQSMIMLYGAEWTTHRGHANTIAASPYDHQRLYDARDDLDVSIESVVRELGVHFSACHPSSSDSWNFSYDMVNGIEVWNSGIWRLHSDALLVWDDLLKSGRRVVGRGGSDAHHGPSFAVEAIQGLVNTIGTPTTWVFAGDDTAEAVVEGLNRGRVSISANPNSVRVALYADADGDGKMDTMMGDNAAANGGLVRFRIDLVGGAGAVRPVKVIKNGMEFKTFTVTGDRFQFEDTPASGERSYYRVEVGGVPAPYLNAFFSPITSTGMVALSNPVYFNYE